MLHQPMRHRPVVMHAPWNVGARRLCHRQRLMRCANVAGIGLDRGKLRIQHGGGALIALRLGLGDRGVEGFHDRVERRALHYVGANDLSQIGKLLRRSPGIGHRLIQVRSRLIVLALQGRDLRQSRVGLGKPRCQRSRLLVVRGCFSEVAIPLQNLRVGIVWIRGARIELDLTPGGGESGVAITVVPREVRQTVIAKGVVGVARDEILGSGEVGAEHTASGGERDETIRRHQLRRSAEA